MGTRGETGFNPNQLTFAEGLERVERAAKATGVKVKNGIVTSRDHDIAKLTRALRTSNVPGGFQKWQLPVDLKQPSQLYISVAAAGANVAKHSHSGDGIRFVMTGSVIYEGQELASGDWMYIPAGAEYSLQIGPHGAMMCYCYCCSCAGREIYPEQGDPAPMVADA
jgi:ChrR-like protein with cupin domain